MNSLKFVTVFILIALLSSAFVPAPALEDGQAALAAPIAKFKVKNQTGADTALTLQGAKSYYFSIPAGNSVVEIERGDYAYSYWACGKEATGNLTSKDSQLVMKACGSGGNDSDIEITFVNKTGEVFWMTFSGPKTVYHQAALQKSTLMLPKGTYTYSYYACGQQNTEKLNVKKKESIQLSCKSAKSDDEDKSGAGGKVKITFNNQTGEVLWITLKGKATVYHQAVAGKSTVELEKGNYNYSYFACGEQTVKGINVKKAETIKLKCGGSNKDDDAKKGTVKVIIQNDTGSVISLYLVGPETYTFQLPTGKQRINVVAGKYQYTVWGCGSVLQGIEKLSGGATWTWWCTP
ncbi:MAG: hypothetical protein JXB38_15970 [Anaerolineales bacterium]|nr:hypothetical protein [Anaerolineales bacterium]